MPGLIAKMRGIGSSARHDQANRRLIGSMIGKIGPFIPVFLIIVATWAVYRHVLGYHFINYDDDGYVYNNPIVCAGLSLRGLIYAFTTTYKGNWIPLTWLSHMADVQLFGLNPAGHHLMNLLFHIANALLLYYFLKKYTQQWLPALIVALFFALHPLHIESVAWISERKDTLSTFFFLLTLIAYGRYVRKHSLAMYLFALLLFTAGLMSKPMVVTLPILLFLIDYWPLERNALQRQKPADGRIYGFYVTDKVPFFLLSLTIGLITIWGQETGGAMASLASIPLGIRLLNAVTAYSKYLYMTVWPTHLAVIYPYSPHIDLLHAGADAFLLILITATAFVCRKKHPYLIVGWLWYLVTLLPVIGLIQVGMQSIADRYTYIPLIGIFIMTAWGAGTLVHRFKMASVVVFPLMAAALLFSGIASFYQLKPWKNSVTLFSQAISVTENNWVAHLNLGEALFDRGEMDAAATQYKKALAINPNFELAYLDLGIVRSQMGDLDGAIKDYLTALRIRENLPTAWLDLGNAYFRKGQLDRAMDCYRRAVEITPGEAAAWSGIGAVLARKGHLQKAIDAFQKAVEIDPRFEAARQNLRNVERSLHKKKTLQKP